jgi:hypothetical protein
MTAFTAALALNFFVSSTCSAGFLTFAEWERLESFPRAMYTAGTFDTLILLLNDSSSSHHSKCIGAANIKTGQLSDNVGAYAQADPRLQRFGAQQRSVRSGGDRRLSRTVPIMGRIGRRSRTTQLKPPLRPRWCARLEGDCTASIVTTTASRRSSA